MTDPITPPGEYAAIILPDDQALLLPLPMLDMEDEA